MERILPQSLQKEATLPTPRFQTSNLRGPPGWLSPLSVQLLLTS